HFSNCWFHDFGGSYKTFYSSGPQQYVLQNCDFTGDTIFAEGENTQLTFLQCRHHTPQKQLLGTALPNLGQVFPNTNGECAEYFLADNAPINAKTCPSPLWKSVSQIMVLIVDDDAPFGRNSHYQKVLLRCDAT